MAGAAGPGVFAIRALAALAVMALAPALPGATARGDAAPPDAFALADTAFLEQYAATFRFRLGRPTAIQPAPDGKTVLFLRSGPRSFVQDLWELDVATGRERVLLTADGILRGAEERLTPEERARRERLRSAARGIASFAISNDARRLLVPLSGRLFVVERDSGAVRELESAAGPAADARFSPDGKRVACVRDGDLWVTDLESGAERRLTRRESGDETWGLPEFVAQEEMGRFEGYWWSPDSRRLAVQRTDTREVERFHILDPGHPERPPQSWPYPRPGRPNAGVTVWILPADSGTAREVGWDRARWPYLARVSWPERGPLTLLVQSRAQTEEAILTADPQSGTTRVLHVERDAVWLNLEGSLPRWLSDGSSFLWSSERAGAWQLELRGRDGRLLRALTALALNYRGLADVDEARGIAWVLAGEEPAEQYLYRVPLDGRGVPERLTGAAGVHEVAFGRDHSIWVDGWEGPSGERRWTLRHADGRPAGTVASVAETPPWTPRVEITTAGPLHFRAAIVRPRDFDPRRRYPVIADVYGGPHSQQVTARGSAHLLAQWIADQGFVVVRLDGRGTPARGRAWERVFKGDFISAPLADLIEGLRALAARHPELDLARVGVTGGSFGGTFAAMAVMRRPDVFRAGVAIAPVVDWRDYDTHYTERYLGTPERDSLAYARSSVLTYVKDLSRPLLVIHGTADDNVYLIHSLKLSDALTREGRPAELWPIVGQTHGFREPLLVRRVYSRLVGFFRRELGGPR